MSDGCLVTLRAALTRRIDRGLAPDELADKRRNQFRKYRPRVRHFQGTDLPRPSKREN